ncbi:hypothetical protein HPP92_014914 [Vanilla planifolia]|uniref:Uncharacterized protein n=1 Tax=Vanilla planifolia TaxID=51239 RepID=A0A835QQG6_VANPL|nr:hypothetical protein HPP92_014914 [Vanilla planifolia]
MAFEGLSAFDLIREHLLGRRLPLMISSPASPFPPSAPRRHAQRSHRLRLPETHRNHCPPPRSQP